ncbi:carboxypeptidase regulatory-like domain-containing protein [Mucilaginibacter rigui]|uniref:Carboxypeptidase regulatory-like domain-containing protein n=1 Tax=Mucilaginibacter rigui TaxID=534635 RepID=A0ABR7X8X6_9SPHI|nr:carboxypeptidase regulatory-like domain-containing protein [Mucilaginibacter rigui]MBD1387033.1 carboxypeptidase regulatory-like domain-containing protein [Mucilaginibacter rigui]
MAYKRFIAGLLLAIGVIGVYSFNSDDDIIARVQRQLDKWTDSNPVEKVHLHFDKPYYTAGDDIWFKAYVITGPLHRLQPDSGILNVELIDEQDSIKQNLKLQLHNGLAYGDFALPDTLHEGNYRIRAYTQYMLNAGSDYIFDKAISIGNVITNKVFTKTTFTTTTQNGRDVVSADINYADASGTAYSGNAVSYSVMLNNTVVAKGRGVTDAKGNLHINLPADNAVLLKQGRIVTGIAGTGDGTVHKSIPIHTMAGYADVQFFAEGGNMINGFPARMAFKAIGTDGLGIAIKGTVTNSKGEEVAQIATSHLGMGAFDFTPESGDAYKANMSYPDGSKASVALPKAADKGYVLRVIEQGKSQLRIAIAAAKGTTGRFVLVGQSAGKVYYSAKSTSGDTFSTIVPKNKFPSGIAQFTLFSESGEPLNERLVFIQNPEDKLNLLVTADNQSYAPRQKVKLNIDARDNGDKPVVGSFSIAVTDESKVPIDENTENNIFANLLLSSDLKGYIEQPAYYFNGSEEAHADLDVLMLTQGYHRFEWKNVLNDTPSPNQYAVQKSFTISGRVTTPSGAPVANGKVELINFDDGLLKVDTVTDPNGRFAFTDVIYADSLKFVIQARNAKNKRDVVIKMDTVPPPSASNYKNIADFASNTGSAVTIYAQNSKQLYFEQIKAGQGNHVISLREVLIREKRIALKHSANLNGPGNADQVLLSKDLVNYGCVRLSDCLQGRLLGVLFNNGVPVTTRGGGRMLVVIDGMYSDAAFMNSLNINDVQSIEVLRNIGTAGIYGGRGANGVLVITTKRGDEPTYYPQQFGRGIVPYHPKGIYKSRIFYSPKYDAKTNQKIADLRTTVFWKPDVVTPGGKASVEYFNAGSPGTYRVVIEGIDSEGNIGRQVLRYKVLN